MEKLDDLESDSLNQFLELAAGVSTDAWLQNEFGVKIHLDLSFDSCHVVILGKYLALSGTQFPNA